MTTYKQAKQQLRRASAEAKASFGSDEPAIRQCINDYADHLIRENEWTSTRHETRLSNYAYTLHPGYKSPYREAKEAIKKKAAVAREIYHDEPASACEMINEFVITTITNSGWGYTKYAQNLINYANKLMP